MAVLEGHPKAADPADPVGGALAKIVRALPGGCGPGSQRARCLWPGRGRPVPPKPRANDRADRARRRGAAAAAGLPDGRRGPRDGSRPVGRRAQAQPLVPPVLVTYQAGAAGAARRPDRHDRDPARHVHAAGSSWTRCGSSRSTCPRTGAYPVDVLVYATVEETATWLPRSLARLEPDEDRTRLRATTDDPDWYARQLARIPAPFAVLGSAELRRATSALGERLRRGPPFAPRRRRGRAGSAECLRHRGRHGRVALMSASDSANRAG